MPPLVHNVFPEPGLDRVKLKKDIQITGWFLRVTGAIQKREYYRDFERFSNTQIFPLETCGAYDYWKSYDGRGNAFLFKFM